ncbi:MAG: hypothetical protein ACYDCO_08065 [Armatimonadota bacterium]
MAPSTLRILIALALFVHGVGHTLGFWMPARSWLLPGVGEPALRVIAGAFWILAAVGFIVACLSFLGLLLPAPWWRPLAVGSAIVSLLGIITFWGTWPAFNTAGAVAMNIAVLAALLVFHWPPASVFGR